MTFAVATREVVADRFLVELRASGPALELRYDSSRLAAADAELLAARLATLLAGAAARPETPLAELPILGSAERERLVHGWNDTRRDLGPLRTLHSLFAAQAARTPESIALVSEAGEPAGQTYAGLDAASDALAAALAAHGIGRGEIVALCLERSPQMVVALLAVLKAGAAFLPIEPSLPAERRSWMLADARPALTLLGPGTPAGFTAPSATLDLRTFEFETGTRFAPPAIDPDELAYVIYTSGSTGRPKGVAVSHGAIANRLLWMQAEHPIGARDAVLQKTPYSFDASLWEIFVPLATGARLVLARPGAHGDVAALARGVAEHGITVLQLVPSLLGPFLATEESALCRGRLRRLFCGGEALPAELAIRARRTPGHLPDQSLRADRGGDRRHLPRRAGWRRRGSPGDPADRKTHRERPDPPGRRAAAGSRRRAPMVRSRSAAPVWRAAISAVPISPPSASCPTPGATSRERACIAPAISRGGAPTA